MEARSLTALNELAANPPQYPEKPTDEKQEPLTLYISRVPGTRDVILSTSKPREKNVTGEDVNNSLYYVYLEMLPDGITGPGGFRDENSWRSSEDSGSSPLTIPRKPVPDSARSLTPDSLSHTPGLPQLQSVASKDAAAIRSDSLSVPSGGRPTSCLSIETPDPASLAITAHAEDVSPNTKDSLERTASGLHTGMPARKPLGPRPISAVNPTDASATLTAPHLSDAPMLPQDCSIPKEGVDGSPKYQDKQLPVLPLDTSVPAGGVDTQPYPVPARTTKQTHSRSPSPRKQSITTSNGNGTPFTLTLIRRDPSTGNQWNVGRVSSRQLDSSEDSDLLSASAPSSTSVPHHNSHPPINIELENSGYAKFRNISFKKNSLAEGGLDAALASLSRGGNLEDRDVSRGEIGVFSRQMAMGYSKSSWTAFRKKLQRIEQAGLSKINRYRSDSVGSVASNTSDTPELADCIVTSGPPPAGMKARGYTFSSPWDGKCDFQTEKDGQSLVCRHTPNESLVNDNYNPLVPDHNSVPSLLRSNSQQISELRFNLPSWELFAEHAKNSKEQWTGNFKTLLKSGNVGHDDDNDDDRNDGAVSPFKLNLGSERAGGGSRGRRAKLGKLIVHDDGLKMLDLVVAANMGIWWGAWEKHF
ncbi:hypothetical protein QQS21_007826 [Conoideocrella luteorostrata]|uniref:Uncharacterized protein n=1 Tax=Conoideocrella luteorostrata TaxID=1105319 RepID=A0AAJ0FWM0_9HYPO|nr:hypothetical protein QQS21_007826 [Conoideocrella luteorostrata]